MSDAPKLDPDAPPARIVDDVLDQNPPEPWLDPWFDGNEEDEWPPRRSGWPTPEAYWP